MQSSRVNKPKAFLLDFQICFSALFKEVKGKEVLSVQSQNFQVKETLKLSKSLL